MGIFSWLVKPNIEKLTTARDVAGLVQILQRKDWAMQRDAALGLARLGDCRGVDFLIAVSQDRNSGAREEAIALLGRSRDPRAVAPLVGLLGEKALCKAVVVALLEYDGKEGVEALWSAIKRGEEGVAALVAGEKNPRAADLLLRGLADENANVRSLTAKALESHAFSCVRAKGASMVPMLLAQRMSSPRRAQSRLPLFLTALPARDFELPKLSWAIAPLGKALRDHNGDVAQHAAMALLTIGTSEAFDTLAQYHAELEASGSAKTNRVEKLLKEYEEEASRLDNFACWTARDAGATDGADLLGSLYSCAAGARINEYRNRIKTKGK
jgi:HEAT repeat protein